MPVLKVQPSVTRLVDTNIPAPPPYTAAAAPQPFSASQSLLGQGQSPFGQHNVFPLPQPQFQQQNIKSQILGSSPQPQYTQSVQGPVLQQLGPMATQQPLQYSVTTAPSGLFSGDQSSGGHGEHLGTKDEKQTSSVQRFSGDSLSGRVARASVQTATSARAMPASLSPWGDDVPVTLPDVSYRDAVLFTAFVFMGAPLVDGLDSAVTSVFGTGSFISEVVSSTASTIIGSVAIKYSVFQIVEQAIDKGLIEHMLPEEERMLQTTNVKSLQVGIKHKFMGVDADIRLTSVYPTASTANCNKGWFSPYLFASARTPFIPRAKDFAVCQFFGPFLGGDYQMAHKLISESAHTLAMCESNPHIDIGTNRMVIVFTGISPFQANTWSTSRQPGCGTIFFHLLDGCPALVVPVTGNAPICAWSPWTLAQMRASQYSLNPAPGMYNPEWQHEQICEWLDTIVSVQHINPAIRHKYVDVLSRLVSLVINGALALEKCKPLLGNLDPERAGIVMFRY